MTRMLKNGYISESDIQKTVMSWARLQPNLKDLIFHIPNESPRSARYGKSLKDLGMKAGVSDLFIAMASHNYHGAWIELKSQEGLLSPAQNLFLQSMATQQYFTAVCHSIEEALKTIKWYCKIS